MNLRNRKQEISFSQIPKTVPPRREDHNLNEYYVRQQNFRSEPKDMVLNFYYSMKLIFNNNFEYYCKQIILSNVGRVELHKAHIFGSISLTRSTVIINECIFEKPFTGVDYFISATNRSTCMISNSSFIETKLYGLCVDDYSEMGLESCIIMKCELNSISVTGHSKLIAQNTSLLENNSNGITVNNESEVFLTNCVIKNTKKKGLSVTSSTSKLKGCSFAFNGSGAVSYTKSIGNTMDNCQIQGSLAVSIKLEDSRLTIENSNITQSKKTLLRATLNSFINCKNTTFSDCKWSLVSIYGSTQFNCTNSLFEYSYIRGINASDETQLRLNGCIFRRFAESAIHVIATKKVFIDDCIFNNCRYSGIDVCDYGFASVNNSIFAGGFENCAKIYTGASCMMNNVSFFGPFHHAIKIFYGGFGFFTDCIFGNLQDALKFDKIKPFAAHATMAKMIDKSPPVFECFDRCDSKAKYDSRFIKVDSKWLTTVTHCYIMGVGHYEIIANQMRIKKGSKIDVQKLKPANCRICRKKAVGVHFSPCGHCTYCKECFQKSDFKQPKRCPVCKSNIERFVLRIDSADDGLCPICYDSQVDSIILPCGHTLCNDCSIHWFSSSSNCPICREANVKVRLFVPYE